MSKVQVFAVFFLIAIIYVGISDAISCQAQRNGNRPAQCHWGGCPGGFRSVYWDSGCASFFGVAQYCCI
ncbi:hypothetical protein HA402_016171 [Bradysia odoriphaga]|nr:hypothetical protein HA402_016171 [Bradysia odoriphaga]